ncbi:FAD-dependent oxidoreductase [Gemmatimonas groenlandica]|uniref:FAD-dependent oxidoreductase n=1 Tax=Gemmatimonas groenlandica TaxID=2732249 RepID=UPI00197F812C|nr:FAD-dependent oxidoreductase [Gemmatimonas groenlandica]
MNDQEIAFAQLTPSQITALRAWGTERPTVAGDVLFAEGATHYPFSVVLDGTVEILSGYPDRIQMVTVHQPGEFVGDADLLTGRASLVTARVGASGRILEIAPDNFRRVIAELPDVSETLLSAFLMRRAILVGEGYSGIKIVGSRFSPAAHALREFSMRNSIPFTWLDVESDTQAEVLLRELGVAPADTPLVIGRGGQFKRNPSVAEFARYMGLDGGLATDTVHDLVVVGAGPAGLGTAVYGASEGLSTLLLDEIAPGGQAATSSKIENYLGFATGISGADLARQALLQAQKFGAQLGVPQTAVSLKLDGGQQCVLLSDGSLIRARTVVVATGVEYRRLEIARLQEFEGAGVYYAAGEMEARLCGGDEVIVVGGGNSAGQAAVFLARHARRVHIVIRGDDLGKSMSRYLVERLARLENVTVHPFTEIDALEGTDRLAGVTMRRLSGQRTHIAARALFIFIGAVPHTAWLTDCVELDRAGFVVTGPALSASSLDTDAWRRVRRAPHFLETSIPGVFAVGDVRSGSVKRVASAVGEGAMAVSFVHAHLGPLR